MIDSEVQIIEMSHTFARHASERYHLHMFTISFQDDDYSESLVAAATAWPSADTLIAAISKLYN